MSRIQLLANEYITTWWSKKVPKRQEKLRDAAEVGLKVLEGELITVLPDKKKLYDAIETLIESGVLAGGIDNLQLPVFTQKNQTVSLPKAPEDVEIKETEVIRKPDLGRLGEARRSTYDPG